MALVASVDYEKGEEAESELKGSYGFSVLVLCVRFVFSMRKQHLGLKSVLVTNYFCSPYSASKDNNRLLLWFPSQ